MTAQTTATVPAPRALGPSARLVAAGRITGGQAHTVHALTPAGPTPEDAARFVRERAATYDRKKEATLRAWYRLETGSTGRGMVKDQLAAALARADQHAEQVADPAALTTSAYDPWRDRIANLGIRHPAGHALAVVS